jgi:mannose-1-phosphate guanylyltransferase/mannose-6-phosphate isomerase
MFSVKAISNELEKYNNGILEYCRKSYENSFRSDDFIKLDSTYYDKITPISIDYAIMEKTNKSIINVVDFSWNDIGSFSRLWEIHEKDADNNVKRGDQIYTDSTRNSYLRSEGPLIATIDIDNLIVVAEKDVTLIAKKGSDNKISQMLSSLKAKNLEQAISHEIVYKPWGYYKILAEGQFFKVKELTIHPNQKLSLQKHSHRAEHWICVDGIAEIEKGEEVFNLKENQSIYIPPNEKHRIINNSSSDLIIIEVQTGQNLDEKDIERIEDDYQRI